MREYEIAQRTLEREVDEEAARLIRNGIASGYEARRIARDTVMEKRRSRGTQERDHEMSPGSPNRSPR